MKVSKLFIFFTLISYASFSGIQAGFFEQDRLDSNATTLGYGYKTSNLMELETLVKDIKLTEGYKVEVPNFVGITSKQIKDFFIANRLKIQEEWDKIISSVNKKKPVEYLKDPNNRKDFIESSEKLASAIEDLKITDKLNLKDVNNFLNSASPIVLRASREDVTNRQRDPWRLMVRSTGKEDTKDLPNAGGNHSEPNVSPDVTDVTNAIKKVVASYFKAKSLNQRIDAGDKDIFADPLTPVLLQRMIGEKIALRSLDELGTQDERSIKEIPVGCVVYTGEVEGQTPGVITIQGAFGHNEGVVSSEVAVDTFYVKNGKIYFVLQIKSQRIIPVATDDGFGLKLINNEDYLKNRQVLSDETVLEINRVARAVHDYYGDPQDIELVYEPSTQTIYLVQTRPLQIIKASVSSYIANLNDVPEVDIAKCATVSAGGGALRFIKNKKQIITASTLEEALNTYLYGGIDQNTVLVVIVKGNAEPTCHAAAIFRGAGKAILTCDEIEKIEKWCDDEEKLDLLIDVQREVVVNVDGLDNFENKTLPELIDSGLVKSGWFKHPISQRLSISGPAFLGPLLEPDKELKKKKYKDLIKIMKEGGAQKAKKALTALMWKLNDSLYKKRETTLQKKKLEQLQKAYNVATRLSQEILESGVLEKEPKNIERLYTINFLEAVLFQPAQMKKYVDVFSFGSVSREYKATKKFIKEKLVPFLCNNSVKKISEDIEALSIMKAGVYAALTKELEKKWISFVNSIISSKEIEEIKPLNHLFATLRKLEILPMWINTIFANENTGTVKEGLRKFFDQLEGSKIFLKKVLKTNSWLDNFDPNGFNDPGNYKKALLTFKQNIKNYFTSYEFIQKLKGGDLLVKEVSMSLMLKIVDVWDASIKALKGSPQYEVRDKVEKFHEMLNVYFSFLCEWSTVFDEKSIGSSKTIHGSDMFLDDIFSAIKLILTKDITSNYEEQLNNSLAFSVEQAAIGRQGAFERYQPVTLEDVFTFIHQSLINIIFIIVKQNYPKINIPVWVQMIEERILAFFDLLGKKKDESYGYEFEDNNLIIQYNLPLRTHSVIFNLKYDKHRSKVFLETRFYGDDEEGRWEKMSDFVDIVSDLTGIHLSENQSIKMTEVFEFEIDKKTDDVEINKVFIALVICIKLSFDTDSVDCARGTSGVKYLQLLYDLFKDKQAVDNSIMQLSLKKNRIHWLLPWVLARQPLKENQFYLDLIDKFARFDSDYFLNTIVFIFKILNDPRVPIRPLEGRSFIGPEYYLINKLNYKEKLRNFNKIKIYRYFIIRILFPLIVHQEKDVLKKVFNNIFAGQDEDFKKGTLDGFRSLIRLGSEKTLKVMQFILQQFFEIQGNDNLKMDALREDGVVFEIYNRRGMSAGKVSKVEKSFIEFVIKNIINPIIFAVDKNKKLKEFVLDVMARDLVTFSSFDPLTRPK